MVKYPIAIFSPMHFLFLFVAIAVAVICARFLAGKFGFSKKVFWVCIFIGLICELERLLFFVRELPEGGYRLPANLIPINACPFMIVLIFILVMSEFPEKRRKLISFMYPMMVAGAFLGMLLAGEALAAHGLSDISTYRYFLYHSMVICLGFYLFFSRPFEYNLKDYGMSLFLSGCFLIAAVWINGFFGWDPEANHMFAVRPPVDGLPILNLNNGWGVYIFNMMWLAVVLISLCYSPVIIKDLPLVVKKIKKKKS